MNDSPHASMKQCAKCKQLKPATIEFFFSDKRQKSGLSPRCKPCKNVDRKPRYIPPEGYKRCSRCFETKLLDEFDRDKAKPKGRSSACKACLHIMRPMQYQQQKIRGPLLNAPEEIVCKKCGISKPANEENFGLRPDCRYGLMKVCKACTYRLYNKPWVATHRDSIRQRSKDEYYPARKHYFINRYQMNREHILTQQHTFATTNPDVVRGWKHRYSKSERGHEIARAREHRRRARARAVPGTHTPEDICAQFKRQRGRCYYCHKKLVKYDVDHVIPLSREGSSNNPWNLVVSCPSCNRRKRDRLPHEWPEGGRLL